MKRPFFCIGLTALVTSFFLCESESIYLTLGLCALFEGLFAVSIFLKHKQKTVFLPMIFFTAGTVCLYFLLFESLFILPQTKLVSDEVVNIKAVLTDYPEENTDRYYCMAKITDEESGRKYKIRLSFSKDFHYDENGEEKISSMEPGDEISFKGKIYKTGFFGDEMRDYFKSIGLVTGAYPTGELTVEKGEIKTLYYYLCRERKRTVNMLLSSLDTETAGLGISVLFGDKSYISENSYENIRCSGASHLLAVSGLHLSLWIITVMKIVESAGLDKRRWSLFLIFFNFLVMFFASFSGSVLRAGFMMLVYLLGFVTDKRADGLNSLGFSAVLILLINPYNARNVSFLLSFIACLAILLEAVKITDYFKANITSKIHGICKQKVINPALSTFVISAFVSLHTFPVVSHYFGEATLVSPLTNVLLIPVSFPLILLFGLYVMFCFIPGVSHFLKFLCVCLSKYFFFITDIMGQSGAGRVELKIENGLLMAFSVILLFVPYVIFRCRKTKYGIYTLDIEKKTDIINKDI